MSNYSRTLDLKGEELMLRSKVELLEDFLAQGTFVFRIYHCSVSIIASSGLLTVSLTGSRGQVVREMRCRALEDKIASMEATIVRTGMWFAIVSVFMPRNTQAYLVGCPEHSTR